MGWQERAACKGKHHLFEIAGSESAFAKNLKDEYNRENLIRQHNESNFRTAFAICNTCPVVQECNSSASVEDRMHTVRAGKYPTLFKSAQRGRPRKVVPEDFRTKKCAHGHVGFYKKIAGQSRCMECRRLSDEARRRKAGAPKREFTARLISGTCKRGHVDLYKKNKKGYRYCSECTRLSRQESRDREKFATMPS